MRRLRTTLWSGVLCAALVLVEGLMVLSAGRVGLLIAAPIALGVLVLLLYDRDQHRARLRQHYRDRLQELGGQIEALEELLRHDRPLADADLVGMVSVGGQPWVRVLLCQITSQAQSFECLPAEVDLAVGAEVRLRLRLPDGTEGILDCLIAHVSMRPNLIRYTTQISGSLFHSGLPMKVLRAVNVRTEPRIELERGDAARHKADQGGVQHHARVRDLSSSGIGLVISQRREQVASWGTKLALQIELPGSKVPFEVDGRICNISAAHHGTRMGIALEFADTLIGKLDYERYHNSVYQLATSAGGLARVVG